MQKFIDALKKRVNVTKSDEGFTLIELIVVVLIIGVLAAIAIPVFLGQQAAAQESAAKANLANAKIAYASFLASNDTEPTLPGDLETLEDFGWPKDASVTVGADVAGEWCLQTGGDSPWHITESGSAATGACGAAPDADADADA